MLRSKTLLTLYILGQCLLILSIAPFIVGFAARSPGNQPTAFQVTFVVIGIVMAASGAITNLTVVISTLVKQAKQREFYWFFATLLCFLFVALVGVILIFVYLISHLKEPWSPVVPSYGLGGQPMQIVQPMQFIQCRGCQVILPVGVLFCSRCGQRV